MGGIVSIRGGGVRLCRLSARSRIRGNVRARADNERTRSEKTKQEEERERDSHGARGTAEMDGAEIKEREKEEKAYARCKV